MNWAQFFQQQGKLLAQVEASNKRADAMEREARETRAALASIKSLLDQQRGAYKAAVAIASLVSALVVIAARLIGLWH
jgi:hypothetical protein